jgi:hypothetical protein
LWLRPDSYLARPRGISIFVHAYLAFIALNATVVFVDGPVRYGALAAVGLLVAISVRRCC